MKQNPQQGGNKSRIFLILLIFVALGYGYYHYHRQQQNKDMRSQLITAVVKKGHIAYTVPAVGTLEASKYVKVGAQISGEIRALYVNIGDTVKKGDKIAEIDAGTQQNTRDSAAAALASGKAALSAAQAELTHARQNYQRQETMFKKGAASRESLENAAATLKSRQAALKQAEATVRRNQLELDNAGVNLSYTTVTAPMDGIVIAVAVEKGQSVNAVQNSPTLVTLAQTQTMTVKAQISEADVNVVAPGMPAYFTLLGKNSERYQGELKSIDPAPLYVSDNQNSAENAVYYYGKMDIANPHYRLRIGMTANMVITVAEADDALLVPMTALRQITPQGEAEVRVLSADGQTQIRPVRIGLQDGVNAQIKTGLNVGESVIISEAGSGNNHHSLRRGF